MSLKVADRKHPNTNLSCHMSERNFMRDISWLRIAVEMLYIPFQFSSLFSSLLCQHPCHQFSNLYLTLYHLQETTDKDIAKSLLTSTL